MKSVQVLEPCKYKRKTVMSFFKQLRNLKARIVFLHVGGNCMFVQSVSLLTF